MKILLAMLVLGVLGGIFGGLLALASKIFYVKVDPKQAAVREFSEQIDILNTEQVMNYGSAAQKNISEKQRRKLGRIVMTGEQSAAENGGRVLKWRTRETAA